MPFKLFLTWCLSFSITVPAAFGGLACDWENGNQIDVLIMIADIYYQKLRYGESVDIYSQIINEYPENQFYKERLANAYYQLELYEPALNYYQEI